MFLLNTLTLVKVLYANCRDKYLFFKKQLIFNFLTAVSTFKCVSSEK